MKAVVKARPGPGAEYLEVETPRPGVGDVLVRVKAAAICGTDVHIYRWNEWAQRTVPKIFGDKPRIMGHEFCGEVVEVGSGVTKVAPGDRVSGETHIACGRCYLCRTGQAFNCQNMGRFKNGVFAEYAVIPEYGAEIVPESIPDDIAALFEPFGVAVHALSSVQPAGDTVAILGAGPIGLLVVALARTLGVARVVASDPSLFRREIARGLGADVVLSPQDEDVVARVLALTDGLGVGIVIETSGSVVAAKQGFAMLRKCGAYVMVGLPSEPLVLDAASDIVWKGARVIGIHGRETFRSWEIGKQLLAQKRIDLATVITHRFGFREFAQAFALCEAGTAGKVILHPAA